MYKDLSHTALKMEALKWSLFCQCKKRRFAVTRMYTKQHHSNTCPLGHMNQKLISWVKSSFFKRKGRNVSTHSEQIVLANNKKILEVSLTCLFFKKFNKGVVFLAGG